MFRSIKEPERPVRCESGRIYFTRKLERKVFFLLTMMMLAAGIFYKLDFF